MRVFLEKRDMHVQRFCEEFKKLTVADEKQDLVDNFLNRLHTEIESDPIWQGICIFASPLVYHTSHYTLTLVHAYIISLLK